MNNSDIAFFDEIVNYNKFDRQKKISKMTNKYDKLLLIEFINEFTEYSIHTLMQLNATLKNKPVKKPILNEGDICFATLPFTFYEIREIKINDFEIISYQNEHFFNRFNLENMSLSFKYTDIIDELNFILHDKHKFISVENAKSLISESKAEPETEISEPQQPKQSNTNFDPNHFNQKGYDLFLYLVEYYDKVDKTKFINIFYYLKYYRKENVYFFNFTENKYKTFVLENHQISLKSFKKDTFDNSSEKHVLNSHEQQFDGR